MTDLEKAAEAREQEWISVCGYTLKKGDVRGIFTSGAKWQAKQSPWIDINDRNIVMPYDKVCLLLLENGVVVIDTEEWEDEYPLSLVTHWMEVPSFDDILKSNKDVLKRIKEKGDK